MVRRLLVLLVFLAILPGQATAQSEYTVKGGINFSRFRGSDSEHKLGYALGAGRQWFLGEEVGIEIEIIYTTERAILKDKIVDGYGGENIFLHDIYSSVSFIEICGLFKYYFHVGKRRWIQFYTGPSLSIGVHDNSELRNRRFIGLANEMGEIEPDYQWNIEPGRWPTLGSSGFDLNLGAGLQWSSLIIECRCSYSLHEIDTVASVILKEKLNTFHVLLAMVL